MEIREPVEPPEANTPKVCVVCGGGVTPPAKKTCSPECRAKWTRTYYHRSASYREGVRIAQARYVVSHPDAYPKSKVERSRRILAGELAAGGPSEPMAGSQTAQDLAQIRDHA